MGGVAWSVWAATAAANEPAVRPGVGVGAVRLGDAPSAVIAALGTDCRAFGPLTRSEGVPCSRWRTVRDLDRLDYGLPPRGSYDPARDLSRSFPSPILFGPDGVRAIDAGPHAPPLATVEGVAAGSPVAALTDAYGPPAQRDDFGGATRWSWPARGLQAFVDEATADVLLLRVVPVAP
jgi:hypothetical protein